MKEMLIPIGIFLVLGYGYFWINRYVLKPFSGFDDRQIQFREQFASGYYDLGFISWAGRASGVLEVIVTHEALFFRVPWFFALFANMYGQLQRIEFSQIREIETLSDKKTCIHFRDFSGTQRRYFVTLQQAEAFRQKLESLLNN